MAHTITLSDVTFAKLQQLARPFIDTPESVIAVIVEEELKRRAGGAGAGRDETRNSRLDPDGHESLTHAKLLSALVDGRPLHRPKWNNLLDHMHILARKRLGSFEAVRRVSGANLRDGRYEEVGFRYLPDADFSIQGVDANLAWDHSLGLARHLNISIEAQLEWRQKPGAARPGERAMLQWSPPNLSVA